MTARSGRIFSRRFVVSMSQESSFKHHVQTNNRYANKILQRYRVEFTYLKQLELYILELLDNQRAEANSRMKWNFFFF